MYTWSKELSRIKNPYLDGYGDVDLSSLSDDNEIPVNSTLKPLPTEYLKDQTAELEKNEVVLHPDGKLFNVLGKAHAYGGTPVNLPDNSFIFSDHKPLAISKEDHELFDFKTGKRKQAQNTPANVLKREVDLQHHNRMIAIQGSDKHDAISKKSSELMLGKNMKKLGQIAFLQEEKKGFPQGLPDFAESTAPVENPQTEKEQTMAKQYQGGGFIQFQKGGRKTGYGNVYGPKYTKYTTEHPEDFNIPQDQLPFNILSTQHKTPRFQHVYGSDIEVNNWKDFEKRHDWYFNQHGSVLGENGKNFDTKDFQTAYNKEAQSRGYSPYFVGQPGQSPRAIDGKFGEYTRRAPGFKGINMPQAPRIPDSTEAPTPYKNVDPSTVRQEIPYNPVTPTGGPLQITQPSENHSILPYEPNVPLTPDQKFSLGADAFNLASINKYAPKRMQESFTPVNLERVNAQPYLNQINNQTQQAYGSNQLTNPIMARAANSQIFGKGLDQVSQTLGNIDNQNRQISNQENMYNNQGINRTAQQNVGLDNQYYNQVQTMNQNYDNESRFARNRLTDKYMQYRSTNDALEMQLASQPTFGTVWVDPKSGQQVDTQGMDEQTLYKKGLRKQAAPLYDYNSKRNSIYYTGAGLDFNSLPNSNRQDNFTQTYQYLINQGIDPVNASKTAAYLNKSKGQ